MATCTRFPQSFVLFLFLFVFICPDCPFTLSLSLSLSVDMHPTTEEEKEKKDILLLAAEPILSHLSPSFSSLSLHFLLIRSIPFPLFYFLPGFLFFCYCWCWCYGRNESVDAYFFFLSTKAKRRLFAVALLLFLLLCCCPFCRSVDRSVHLSSEKLPESSNSTRSISLPYSLLPSDVN